MKKAFSVFVVGLPLMFAACGDELSAESAAELNEGVSQDEQALGPDCAWLENTNGELVGNIVHCNLLFGCSIESCSWDSIALEYQNCTTTGVSWRVAANICEEVNNPNPGFEEAH